jgi:inosose dehydratase
LQTELRDREGDDDDEQDPRHRGGGAEGEVTAEAGVVDVLDNRAGRIGRAPARQNEHQNLLIDGGGPLSAAPTADDYHRVAEVANLVGSIARDAGLVCSWHQHWGTLFERPEAFDALMELTDPELVKFCPDTAQLTMGDFDVLATFRKYARRVGFVHFKDLDANRPWEVTAGHGGPSTWSDTGAYSIDSKWRFAELGRGRIDFPALLAVLREAGYDGWIEVDLDYSAYPTRQVSTTLLRYLRGVLGIVGRRGRIGWAG